MGANLVIQQVADKFQVTRTTNFKTSEPVQVPSPYTWPVDGRPNSNLMAELQWYLEGFLAYPFPPETEHAERVLDALKRWGEEAFKALFGNLSAVRCFTRQRPPTIRDSVCRSRATRRECSRGLGRRCGIRDWGPRWRMRARSSGG